MTRLRKMVAARLKDAQNTAAMLTTFNEVDMTAANSLRTLYKDSFEEARRPPRRDELFCKACVVALKEFPAVNAAIEGDDIVYENHYDIAIAVSSPQGLVVPVVRDCVPCRWRRSRRRFPTSASAVEAASSPWRRCWAAPSPSPTAASSAR
ncbi:MAG: 2-oxo acid dehydrogenase subunit E2 [Rhodospirillales bacterium]